MASDNFSDRAGGGLSGSSWNNTSGTTGSVQDTASRLRDQAAQQGSAALDSLKEGARSLGDEARDRASGYVEGGKQAVTDSLEAFAQAIRKASDELSQRDQTTAAQLIRTGASTLERVTRSIEGTNLEDMIRQVRNFARNNPTAFIGATMLAGFALARFARASSQPQRGDWNAGGSMGGDDRGFAGSEDWSGGQTGYAGGSYGSGGAGGSYGSGAGGGSSYGSGGGGGGGSYGSGAGESGGGSYGSGAGGSSFGSGSSGGGSSFGSGGGSGSSFGSSSGGGLGTGSSYPSNTGGAGEIPPGSQGYGGGGMGTDPIQSSGPSSETDESVTTSSGSSGFGSSSISTGGDR